NDVIKAPAQFADVFDRQLPCFKVRQVVFLFQRFSVMKTRRADIDGDDARGRMTEREPCSLPRSTTSDEYVEVGAVFRVGPKQMKLGTMDVFVLPHVADAIEIFERRSIRVICVKLAYRVC